MPVHAFVDETKVRGLLVVAATAEPRDLAPSRTVMRNLLLPRQWVGLRTPERRLSQAVPASAQQSVQA